MNTEVTELKLMRSIRFKVNVILVICLLNMVGFFVLTGNQGQIFHAAVKAKVAAEEVKEQAIVVVPPSPPPKKSH